MNILFPQNCVERLIDTNSPSLDTIKMQVHFDMNYSSRGNSYMCIQAKGGSLHMSEHISTFAIRVREGTIVLLSVPPSDDFLKEHHRVLNSRLQPVVRDITDARARGKDELEGTLLIMEYVIDKDIL